MPAIEENENGRRSGNRPQADPNRFSGASPSRPAAPAPAAARPAPSVAAPRFTRTNVSPLQPYTYEAPQGPAPYEVRAQVEQQAQAQQQQGKGLTPWENPGWPGQEARQQAAGDATEREVKTRQAEALDPVLKRSGPVRSYEMTWEDYNALSPEQRAAVDFNTLLVKAREKDLSAQYDATPQQRKIYDTAVEGMFGEGKGSEVFAPETLAVLRSVGYKASGDDLDEFLSLDKTISEKELAGFTAAPVEASVRYADGTAQASGARTGEAQLATGTAKLQETLAKSRKLVQDFQSSAALAMQQDVQVFGGQPDKVRLGFGYAPPGSRKNPDLNGIDEFFQNVYSTLTWKKNDEAVIGAKLAEARDLLRPDEMDALVTYIDDQLTRQQQYSLDKGPGKDRQYRDPDEVRLMIGLKGRGGNDG